MKRWCAWLKSGKKRPSRWRARLNLRPGWTEINFSVWPKFFGVVRRIYVLASLNTIWLMRRSWHRSSREGCKMVPGLLRSRRAKINRRRLHRLVT